MMRIILIKVGARPAAGNAMVSTAARDTRR
jgi:hypothetical protein